MRISTPPRGWLSSLSLMALRILASLAKVVEMGPRDSRKSIVLLSNLKRSGCDIRKDRWLEQNVAARTSILPNCL